MHKNQAYGTVWFQIKWFQIFFLQIRGSQHVNILSEDTVPIQVSSAFKK